MRLPPILAAPTSYCAGLTELDVPFVFVRVTVTDTTLTDCVLVENGMVRVNCVP